jgi:hypothetical protein
VTSREAPWCRLATAESNARRTSPQSPCRTICYDPNEVRTTVGRSFPIAERVGRTRGGERNETFLFYLFLRPTRTPRTLSLLSLVKIRLRDAQVQNQLILNGRTLRGNVHYTRTGSFAVPSIRKLLRLLSSKHNFYSCECKKCLEGAVRLSARPRRISRKKEVKFEVDARDLASLQHANEPRPSPIRQN